MKNRLPDFVQINLFDLISENEKQRLIFATTKYLKEAYGFEASSLFISGSIIADKIEWQTEVDKHDRN